MKQEILLTISPKQASDKIYYLPLIEKKLKIKKTDIKHVRILKKSIDARQRNIKINLKLLVFSGEKPNHVNKVNPFYLQDVINSTEIIVIGSGPAGLFAALKLIELGYKPVIFERGKEVSERKRDIALLNSADKLNPESNYCFGEGGAGTFSDGKLYTRSKKRGDTNFILNAFYAYGAREEILYDAHPHIGSDKLPGIIRNIRKDILNYGGQINFNSRVTDIRFENDCFKDIVLHDGSTYSAKACILATGHSAKDIYEILNHKKILLQAKGFALGVRVEHPQQLIDSVQYNQPYGRGDYLPAAAYRLTTKIENRGVYSFCMCPGGMIVPSATAHNQVVVNGMSSSKRSSPYANSGMVVEISPEDIGEFKNYGPLGGLYYQQHIEHLAFQNCARDTRAPAQKLTDFVNSRLSSGLPECSYLPGVVSSPLHFWLPGDISKRLQLAFKEFNKKMKGFLSGDAILLGVESRTSSPVRIPRDKEMMQHVNIRGLFPCGEGSGYTGGIMSSAIDGVKIAVAIANQKF